MCPFCVASLALMVSGTISTGGLTALGLQGLRKNLNTMPRNTKMRRTMKKTKLKARTTVCYGRVIQKTLPGQCYAEDAK
jgi:hypothetical protein